MYSAPKQNPNNPYAAVIPVFCKHFIKGTRPTINGDGETSRDFTFVENAVQANVITLLREIDFPESQNLQRHEVFNVACGDQITLNEMIKLLQELTGKNIEPIYGPERAGDVKHSKASIRKISDFLYYNNLIRFNNGLDFVIKYYTNKF